MLNLNEFFNDLAANNSRNFKLEQLNIHKDNLLLKEVVRLALDPFTNFYQRKIPEYRQHHNVDITIAEAINQLGYLSNRVYTGNAAIAHLSNILANLPEDKAKVIERIVLKDLRCGVSISTALAVWPTLIKEYPVMLCSQFSQKLIDKIEFPAYVQTKMDGMRFNAIVKDGKVDYRSRNGKEIQLLGNLDEDFIKMAGDTNCVFDGELLVKDKNGVILDRQTGNGILNKANKGTISETEASQVCATIWDLIPYDLFTAGKCVIPYGERWNALSLMIDEMKPAKVSAVDSWEVDTIEEANVLFEKLLASGQEGIILKDRKGIWENKRTKHQIKFKGEFECDLVIVNTEKGTGKYESKLGAIVCESSCGLLQVSVGSGFSDIQRGNLKHEDLVGKIVAVKYNARIKNKQNEESLFLPIFVEIREDKDAADSLKDIT